MRKSTIGTILKFSLVQLLGFILISVFVEIYKANVYYETLEFLAILSNILIIIFVSLGFILLGFHLRKKFGELKFWDYALIGLKISLITSITFFLPKEYFMGKEAYGDFSLNLYIEQLFDDLDFLFFLIGIMMGLCLLVGKLLKKLHRN